VLSLSATSLFSPCAERVARRAIIQTAAAGLFVQQSIAPAVAEEGGVQWTLDLPDSFEISRRLASIVRVRVETMLAAEDRTGLQAKLVLVPFGQQAAGSFSADEQLSMASYFLSPNPPAKVTKSEIAATLAASAARSPSVLTLTRVDGTTRGYTGSGLREFVQYQYVVEKCSVSLDDGECFGDISKRRNVATATMSSISQYRTNTERQRMAELGQVREVNVLWLLTLSAPESMWNEDVSKRFQAIASSFALP